MTFEYKVVPAPTRARRVKGAKTPADRFARAVEDAINLLAEDGWEYLRTDTLPAEQRQGLTGRTTVYQNLLVFRRALDLAEDEAPATTKSAPTETPRPAPSTPAGEGRGESTTLNTLIEREISAALAPKLPSAGEAQTMPETSGKPKLAASRDDMAAE